MRLLIDGHLDMGWSAVSMNRDLTEPVAQMRAREVGLDDQQSRGRATVALPEMRRGGVAVCLPTLLARARREKKPVLRETMDYGNQDIAHAMAHAQLAYYRALSERGEACFLGSVSELNKHWQRWQELHTVSLPIGFILSMEGADPILHPRQTEAWWEIGLRVLSLVHYGIGPYAAGTSAQGGVSAAGYELLREMERLGLILDVTHLTDAGFVQALDRFGGPVVATHSNCRALVSGQRQLTDAQIRRLIERGAVIGAVADIWMLSDQWPANTFNDQGFFVSSPEARDLVRLEAMAAHIDHVCQLAGNADHAAIGSDLDGGYGTEQSPADLDTIADLQILDGLLKARGFGDAEIDQIFHGNWLRFFRQHLSA